MLKSPVLHDELLMDTWQAGLGGGRNFEAPLVAAYHGHPSFNYPPRHLETDSRRIRVVAVWFLPELGPPVAKQNCVALANTLFPRDPVFAARL